jgi:hypothetical protein
MDEQKKKSEELDRRGTWKSHKDEVREVQGEF